MAIRSSSQTGLWSASSTWGGQAAPTIADDVTINVGHTVTIDTINAGYKTLMNHGVLKASRTATSRIWGQFGNYVSMMSGEIDVGKPLDRLPAGIRFDWYLTLNEALMQGGAPHDPLVQTNDVGIWLMDTSITNFHGVRRDRWTDLSATASGSSITIKSLYSHGWAVGDEIILPDTHFPDGVDQTETRRIKTIVDNGNGTKTITLGQVANHTITQALTYSHTVTTEPWTDAWGDAWTEVLAGKVGNLETNISISTRKTDGTLDPDNHSHVMAMDSSEWYIEDTRFENLSPKPKLNPMGRYFFHTHQQNDGSRGNYFRYNALVGAPGIAVSGSDSNRVGGGVFSHESWGVQYTDCVTHKVATSVGSVSGGQKAAVWQLETTFTSPPCPCPPIWGNGIFRAADDCIFDRILNIGWAGDEPNDERATGMWLGGTKNTFVGGCVGAGMWRGGRDSSAFHWPESEHDGEEGIHVYRIEAFSILKDAAFFRQNVSYCSNSGVPCFEDIVDALFWRVTTGECNCAYVNGYHWFQTRIFDFLAGAEHSVSQRRWTGGILDGKSRAGSVASNVDSYLVGSDLLTGNPALVRGESVYRDLLIRNVDQDMSFEKKDKPASHLIRGQWTSANEMAWLRFSRVNWGVPASGIYLFMAPSKTGAGTVPNGIETDDGLVPPRSAAANEFTTMRPDEPHLAGGRIVVDGANIAGKPTDFVLVRLNEFRANDGSGGPLVGYSVDASFNAQIKSGTDGLPATFPKPARIKATGPADDSVIPANGILEGISFSTDATYGVWALEVSKNPGRNKAQALQFYPKLGSDGATWTRTFSYDFSSHPYQRVYIMFRAENGTEAVRQTDPDSFSRITTAYSRVLRAYRPLTTPAAEPTKPTLTAFTAPSATSLSWNHSQPANSQSYKYYYSLDAGANWVLAGQQSATAPALPFVWNGATPNTAYRGRVSSVGPSSAEYPSTEVIDVTTADVAPAQPTPLSTINITETTATIRAQDNATNEAGFDSRWRVKAGPGAWQEQAPDKAAETGTGNIVSWALTGLPADTELQAEMWSKNAIGESAHALTEFRTAVAVPPEPSAPTLNSVVVNGPQSITANFTANGTGALSFTLQSSPAGAGTWTDRKQVVSGTSIVWDTSVTPAPSPNTAYDIRVVANGPTTNPASASAAATTPAATPSAPVSPQFISVTDLSAGFQAIDASGNDGDPETAFEMDLRTPPSTGPWVAQPNAAAQAGEGGIVSWGLAPLLPNTEYEGRVRAVNGTGNSAYVTATMRTLSGGGGGGTGDPGPSPAMTARVRPGLSQFVLRKIRAKRFWKPYSFGI